MGILYSGVASINVIDVHSLKEAPLIVAANVPFLCMPSVKNPP